MCKLVFIAAWKTCRYKEFGSTDIQNAKTSTTFLKRGEYLDILESFYETYLILKFVSLELTEILVKAF